MFSYISQVQICQEAAMCCFGGKSWPGKDSEYVLRFVLTLKYAFKNKNRCLFFWLSNIFKRSNEQPVPRKLISSLLFWLSK